MRKIGSATSGSVTLRKARARPAPRLSRTAISRRRAALQLVQEDDVPLMLARGDARLARKLADFRTSQTAAVRAKTLPPRKSK